MAEGDSERRLQKVMDKLYHSPRPKRSLPSSSERGKRAALDLGARRGTEKGVRTPTTAAASGGMLGPAPPCRPWDRGDLMRRLATFKAMTWFGKPKAISPVNCARRGWINVEMDVIACEACGARLLFSTPSSWTLQQVEKAAAVFSLKLDNGHKLLCPWIDNACDEALALFPPTPPLALVETYNDRSLALLRILALPVISPTAIDYMKMKSPQLEKFLLQPSHQSVVVSNGFSLTMGSKSKDLEGEIELSTADLYCQAQKIISLCGWEPRLLPYVVDSEDQSDSFARSASTSEPSEQKFHEQKESVTVYLSSSHGEESGENIEHALCDYDCDPASVVLDCPFCGACVALWAFATIQRPLELYSLISVPNSGNEPSTGGAALVSRVEALPDSSGSRTYSLDKAVSNFGHIGSAAKEKSLGLNLTIAGGPPPTKQHFRPRVSFPIVSRHLRSQLSYSRTCLSYEDSCRDQARTLCVLENDDLSHHQKDIYSGSEGARSPKQKRTEDKLPDPGSSDVYAVSHSELNVYSGNVDPSGDLSLEGQTCNEQGVHRNSTVENLNDAVQNTSEVLHRRESDSEKGEAFCEEREVVNSEKVGGSLRTTSNAVATHVDAELCVNNSGAELTSVNKIIDNGVSDFESLHRGETSEHNYDNSLSESCSVTTAALPSTHSINPGNGQKYADSQNSDYLKIDKQKASGLRPSSSLNLQGYKNQAQGKKLKPVKPGKISEFDPIRQHRSYCPWIAPDDGETMPGWKLTLLALVHQEDPPRHLHMENTSMLCNEVDDPIVSVRKLFTSPPPKRLKSTQ